MEWKCTDAMPCHASEGTPLYISVLVVDLGAPVELGRAPPSHQPRQPAATKHIVIVFGMPWPWPVVDRWAHHASQQAAARSVRMWHAIIRRTLAVPEMSFRTLHVLHATYASSKQRLQQR